MALGLETLIPQVGMLELIMIAIKVIVLIFIVKWVRARITGSTAVTIVTILLSYFILFEWASFWIPLALFIIVLPHGPLDIMFDLALGGGGGAEAGEVKKKKASQAKKRKMSAKKKARIRKA